jgi:hypothetical protein
MSASADRQRGLTDVGSRGLPLGDGENAAWIIATCAGWIACWNRSRVSIESATMETRNTLCHRIQARVLPDSRSSIPQRRRRIRKRGRWLAQVVSKRLLRREGTHLRVGRLSRSLRSHFERTASPVSMASSRGLRLHSSPRRQTLSEVVS